MVQNARQAKILVIDDDPDVLHVVRHGLKLPGLNVAIETASSGRKGITKALRFRPDLVILDLLLPGLDGFAVAKRLRADPALKKTKIIMLTALDTDVNRWESVDRDIDDFVGKPFDLFELESRVRYQLIQKKTESSKQ